MALVRDEYWLNWPVGKGAGKDGRAEELWRVEKNEEVGFESRKKLITRERERQTDSDRDRETEREFYKGGKESS